MKKYFTYADVLLDKRWTYTPSHTIYIPNLVWKAEVFDEAKTPIETPNSIVNFGYIEITDETAEQDVIDLLALPTMHGIKQITQTEAKAMLINNGYIENPINTFELIPAGVDELTGNSHDAVIIIID